MLLTEAIKALLIATRADGRSPETVKGYRRKLKPLVAFLGDVPVEDITIDDMRRYSVHLRDQPTRWSDHPKHREKEGGLSSFTIHSYIAHAKRLFNWLEEEGTIQVNPVRRIKNPQPKRREPKAIELEHFLALLATTESESVADLRDRAILFFLTDTGCRVGGLCGLRVKDIKFEKKLAVLVEKGDETRMVPFNPPTAEALKAWLEVRPQDQGDWLFVSLSSRAEGDLSVSGVEQMLKRKAKQAGITGTVNPHSFRHAFAREFLMSGGDLGTLSDLLGHTDIKVTKDYYAIFLIQDLQKKHQRHSPVARLFGGNDDECP